MASCRTTTCRTWLGWHRVARVGLPDAALYRLACPTLVRQRRRNLHRPFARLAGCLAAWTGRECNNASGPPGCAAGCGSPPEGIWVEGCAEELGFDALLPILQQGVLQLPPLANWQVLTHADGTAGWPCNLVLATYAAEPTAELTDQHPAVLALQAARSIFWTSGSQYAAFRRWVPADAKHACRYGKTYNYLRDELQAVGDECTDCVSGCRAVACQAENRRIINTILNKALY